MAVEKVNLYTPGKNLTNQGLNIDYNRLSDDKTFIEVSFATSPATVTIKAGSFLETNGALYRVSQDDEVFQMSDAGHSFITYDGTTFASAATRGTKRPDKQGYYQSDDISRTLKWNIDQDNERYDIDYTVYFETEGLNIAGDLNSTKIFVYLTSNTTTKGIISMDSVVLDTRNEYVTNTFTVTKAGVYKASLSCSISLPTGTGGTSRVTDAEIYYNGSIATRGRFSDTPAGASAVQVFTPEAEYMRYMDIGDTIQFYWDATAVGTGETLQGSSSPIITYGSIIQVI
jgi:hypothetical protein